MLLVHVFPLFLTVASIRASSNRWVGYNVTQVASQASALSSFSWELGTASEAFLELFNPELSAFGENPFPFGKLPAADPAIYSLKYARPHILTSNQTLIDGDGAVGDPASLGVSALLLGTTNRTYFEAAQRECENILNVAPRYWNGAISQRNNTPELWADFSYMALPFLAYNAVATQNTSLLRDAIGQFTLQRQILQSNTTAAYRGLWEHIIGPNDFQPGLWSTGNGWVVAAMARVLATVQKWNVSKDWVSEQEMLKEYAREIIDGAMNVDKDNGLLRNFLNDTTWFGETSGTALITATVYRMAVLAPDVFGESYITWADSNRQAVAAHVDASGILSPAVDPYNWNDETPFTTGSPEGESFGVLLYTAYRDCLNAGVCK